MRVANKIWVGGIDYVRLERGEVRVELYTGEVIRYVAVSRLAPEIKEKEEVSISKALLDS
jgi:hypothetical protein